MNRFSCLLVLVAIPSVAFACTGGQEDEQSSSRTNEIVADDATKDDDKDDSARRPGGDGVACGSVTCGAGQVCCNASCGICTAPDMSCIQLACDSEPEPKPKPCIKTGCSGQICADQDMASTCEWLPQYACYQSAICERQADGACGFRETKELKQCLSDSGSASK